MDRRAERGIGPFRTWRGYLALIVASFGLLTASLTVAADGLPEPLLQLLRWTDRSHYFAAATSRPKSCLTGSDNRADAEQIARGAVLFQSPALLGGQASRGRLSCASCHTNGRDNPHFFLGGISDRPGMADVTSSFFGVERANGRFDPVLIPDLAQPGRISRDRRTDDLEHFIRVLIVDEFSGTAPHSANLADVAAYVRALRICTIDPDGREAILLDDQLQAVRDGVAGAVAMTQAGYDSAAQQMVAATRHQLGLLSERYAPVRTGAIDRTLSRYSLRLADVSAAGQPAATRTARLIAWLADFERDMVPTLERHRGSSYYNSVLLHPLLDDGRARAR